MTIHARAYAPTTDYWRIRDLLVETYALNQNQHNWCIERWDCARYKGVCWADPPTLPQWESAIRLWETDDRKLVGVAHYEDVGRDAFFQVHPAYRHLEPDMIAWAEAHLAVPTDDGRRRIATSVFEFDWQRQATLTQRGYTRTDWWGVKRWCPLIAPLPVVNLPEGFTVRALRMDDDLADRCAVSDRAFNSSIPMSVAHYRHFQTAPGYRIDNDLVVVGPDGRFVAFATVWLDALNRIGIFEPVGTDPAHQRKGFGRAVMVAGLRRLQALGATMAWVGTGSDPAANGLYEATGFVGVHRETVWEKFL
jgi:mycothiol synthase